MLGYGFTDWAADMIQGLIYITGGVISCMALLTLFAGGRR